MPREPGLISVESLYGYQTDQPLVRLTLADADPTRPPVAEVYLSPAKARAIAMSLLESAEAATSDAFLVHFCRDLQGTDTEAKRKEGDMMGAQFVRELRNFRELLRRQGDEQEAADQEAAQARWEREPPDVTP